MCIRVSIFVLALVGAGGENRPPDEKPAIQRKVEFIFRGMKDERQRLRSGVYRASGRIVSESPGKPRLAGETTVFCAFDDTAGLLRFDRVYPVRWLPGAPGPKERPSAEQVAPLDVRYIQTPEQSIRWSSVEPGIAIDQPTPKAMKESQTSPFDVRTFGFDTSISTTQRHALDETFDTWSKRQIHEVREEAGGIYRLTWQDEGEDAEWRVTRWVDTKHGYTIMRAEWREREKQADSDGPWPEPHLFSEVSWQEFSGAWVPKAFLLKSNTRTDELAFDWESVNDEIPEKLFTAKGLEIDPWTLVTDVRLGKPIIVGHVDRPNPVLPRADIEPTNRMFWFIGSSIALAVTILAFVAARRRAAP